MSQQRIIIGFANQSEDSTFAITVREHLEVAAAKYPEIELVLRDNARSTEQALANVQEFLDIPVDVAILFHIDERAGNDLVFPLRYQRIPVIAIDIPLSMAVFFGTNVQSAGESAGTALAEWIHANWDGQIDKVLVVTDRRVLNIVQQRFDSALSALHGEVGFDENALLYVDCGGDQKTTMERTADVLQSWGDVHHIAILCISDDIAAYVLDAARALDREQDIAVLSYDGTPIAIQEFRRPGSRLIVSPIFPAEAYGEQLIDLSLRLLNGENVPRVNYVEPICLTRDNFEQYL